MKALPRNWLLFICFVVLACGIKPTKGRVTDAEEKLIFRDSANNLTFPFYGDYWFHPYKKKHFINTTEPFLKYAAGRISNAEPRLLFSAHTIVEPYLSVIGVVYRIKKSDRSLLSGFRKSLSYYLGLGEVLQSAISTEQGEAIKWQYKVYNPLTKTSTTHLEYFIFREADVLRFMWWTSESNLSIFSQEAEGLTKMIKGY